MLRSFRFERKHKTKRLWKIPIFGSFFRKRYFANLKTWEINSPEVSRREEHERAYTKVKNREKACINCEYAFPVPFPCCQLGVTCMRKPPRKTRSVWKLRFYSALTRFEDASIFFTYETCRKFKQRENPELFLRQLVWIKRFIWFLGERYYWGDIDDSYVPVAMKNGIRASDSSIEKHRRTCKPKVTPLPDNNSDRSLCEFADMKDVEKL